MTVQNQETTRYVSDLAQHMKVAQMGGKKTGMGCSDMSHLRIKRADSHYICHHHYEVTTICYPDAPRGHGLNPFLP